MKAPARAHTEIFSADGSELIGEVTSGGFGPTLGKAIAMGYVLFCTFFSLLFYFDFFYVFLFCYVTQLVLSCFLEGEI